MRNLLAFCGLVAVSTLAACSSPPAPPADPPVLKVMSPARSLVQAAAGQVAVTGLVDMNAEHDPIASVTVNGTAATVAADGSFSAMVSVPAGVSLLHTIATDSKGTTASDTRSVQAGATAANGTTIINAVTAAISTEAFGKISDAAATLIKTTDMATMLAPYQPMQHAGDEDGPDCNYDEIFVDNIKMGDAHFALTPTTSGLGFSLEFDSLAIPGHAGYALLCAAGSDTFNVTADKVIVTGTLTVVPDGKSGVTTTLNNPNVAITNLNVDAGGLPGDIIKVVDFTGLLTTAVEHGAEDFMGPMMTQAMVAVGGAHSLMVMGETITTTVTPTAVNFNNTGATVNLDATVAIAGVPAASHVTTAVGNPDLSAGTGFEAGIADDLANELLSQFAASGKLNLAMPATGGSFDGVNITMVNPPMISPGADGKLHLVAGDMGMQFTLQGKPVGTATLNATLDVAVAPGPGGATVAATLSNPVVAIDVADDGTNATRFADDDLSALVTACINDQIQAMTSLLAAIPIPSVAGLQVENVSVGASAGYLTLSGAFE